MKTRSLLSALAFQVLSLVAATAQLPSSPPSGIKILKDLDYVGKGHPRQQLDLYLPETKADKARPLIVFIHGGAWAGGSKQDGVGPLSLFLSEHRYAAASLGYRLTNEASWPAQIHDCKAALRWLGQHATKYDYDINRIALFGVSAGGHLVSLLGTSIGDKALEGSLGLTEAPAPRIQCVINFCGPTNFLSYSQQGGTIDPDDPKNVIAKFFGGPMKEHLELAKVASPVHHVTPDDPPFLHIHGTNDELVPYAQAQEFDAAFEKVGVSSTLLTGTGAGHAFLSEELIGHMRAFLAHHLLGQKGVIPEGPVAIK